MKLTEILHKDLIHLNVSATSQKSALELISQTINQHLINHTELEIFDHFFRRERIGSTAIGNGVALPHARLDNNNLTLGVFLSLKYAIPFDAIDGKPVNLIFALVVPEHSTSEHLKILSQLAGFFRVKENIHLLSQAEDIEEVFQLFDQL